MNEFMKKRLEYINAGRPLPEKKKTYTIPKIGKKRAEKIAEQKAKGSDLTLDKWFDHFMEVSIPKCAECGMEAHWLKEEQEDPKKKEAYRLMWRACQAHILPKKKRYGFPSVATHPDNHIVLFPSWGGHLCGHHGEYDSSWFNASTMKIWPQIVEKFKRLYPLIPENERKNIPEVLLKTLEQ